MACFTSDARLTDEARSWHGAAEIRQWFDTVATAFDYTMEVLINPSRRSESGPDQRELSVRLSGNFPGGVVDLTYSFRLRDGVIAGLQIAPLKENQ